jgi:hypothetical protein
MTIGYKIKVRERRPIGLDPYWEVNLEKHQCTKLAEMFFTCTSKENADDLSIRLASALRDNVKGDAVDLEEADRG